MINTKKIEVMATPETVVLVTVTPADLRIVADRLEQKEKTTAMGEFILYPVTHGITLCYQPDLNSKVRELTDFPRSSIVAHFEPSLPENLEF